MRNGEHVHDFEEADMAELTPLDEKIGEVLGLAKAAQGATSKVAKMEGADEFRSKLEEMNEQAAETQKRTEELIESFEGRKTAIQEKAQETKSEAEQMMQTYLEGEEEALDGFEFLTMAEAGELGHWEIVQRMSQTTGESQVAELADWAVDVQRRHFETVRESSLALAESEARG
jgi:flagellar hook-basal body complex protein FliE